jgi:methylase of polypeptide subunit release factors
MTRAKRQNLAYRPLESGSRLYFDEPLPAAVLNIEEKSRSNLFAWRGQFSPQLVEALLDAYCDPDMTVLDPFMGSGTVLVEAARRGHEVYGTEVNPAAYLIARLYHWCNVPESVRVKTLKGADSLINQSLGEELPLFKLAKSEPSTGLVSAARSTADPAIRDLLEAVVVLSDLNGEHEQNDILWRRWRDLKRTLQTLPFSEKPTQAVLGDARQLSLPKASVDFVISSPPYINVFNYHHHYRPSVESLGWQPLVVARSEIGANRKFRQNRFLTVVQYCIDMALALAELRRVGQDGLRAILILGRESNVHMTPFFNGEIIAELATRLVGFRQAQSQERVFTNRFGQSIFEDILHLEAASSVGDRVSIVKEAKEFGTSVLVTALRRVPEDRRRYLEEAIAEAEKVEPSPILVPSAAGPISA